MGADKEAPCLIILEEDGACRGKKREELEKLTDCVLNSPATNADPEVVKFWKKHGIDREHVTVMMSIEAQLAMRAERGDDHALSVMLGLAGADSRIVLNWHRMEMAEKRLKLEEEKMRRMADREEGSAGSVSELLSSLASALDEPPRTREIQELISGGGL